MQAVLEILIISLESSFFTQEVEGQKSGSGGMGGRGHCEWK